MTSYIIASDKINGKERTYISKISSKLKKAGHTVKSNGVGPNTIQNASGQKGKTGIFLVGGSDAGMYVDFVTGLKKGYYKYDKLIVAFASWIGNDWITEKGLKNKKLKKAHDDNYSTPAMLKKVVGKTVEQYFSENSKYIEYVYGNNAEELAESILNGSTNTKSEKTTSSSSSFRQMLQELADPLDGDIEIRVVLDTVYINKIPTPESDLVIIEGYNLISGSLTISDYNPETVNNLVVLYGKKKLTISDEYLIHRFGKKTKTIEAVKTITTYSENKGKTESDNGSNSKSKSKTETKKITTYKEALEFGKREFNKLRRNDGHVIECKVFGGQEWQVGKWCRVFIPRFNEFIDMYISRTSHTKSSSDELICSLTLQDYAPKVSVEKQESSDSDSESKDSKGKKESEKGAGDGKSGSSGSGSGSGSSKGKSSSNSDSAKWTKIATIVNNHIEVSPGMTNQYIRRLLNAGNSWSSIQSIVAGHNIKGGVTRNYVIRAILNAKK